MSARYLLKRRLIGLRNKTGWRQREVAQFLGLTLNRVAALELARLNPPEDEIHRIISIIDDFEMKLKPKLVG